MNQPSPRFWSFLAGIRFLLAMWVLFDHTYNFAPKKPIPVLTESGLMAVMCFFVISGFSIAHSLEARPKGYFGRRFWRVFPLNALAVLIGWIAWSVLGISGGYATPQIPPTLWDFVGCLLLLEVFLPVLISFFFPAWSLSLEVCYYCCAPLLRRFNRGMLVPFLMLGSCLFFILWPYIRNEYIAARASDELAAIGMMWSWLAGWTAYYKPRSKVYLFSLLLGGAASTLSQAKFFAIVDFASAAVTCIAWAGTLFIVFYRIGDFAAGRRIRALDYLGELSFPVYLLHYPVLFVFTSTVAKTHPEINSGYFEVVVSLFVAVLAYHFVDAPLRARSADRSQSKKIAKSADVANGLVPTHAHAASRSQRNRA